MFRSSLLRIGAILILAGAVSACNSTFARKETLGYAAGDAVAWNKAVHVIDPWPAASADTTIPVSGRRVATAIETYENGGVPPGAGPGPAALIPIAPMAPGPTP